MTTTTIISPGELETAARALVSARRTNLGIEVTMPVVYPNGQMITVVITTEQGDYVVHDAGTGAMCLTASGARLSTQLERRLAELAQHYGCEFIDGRMMRRASEAQLALAIVMVANASRTVGDQSIYVRRQQDADFREAVTERVRELVGKRLRSGEDVRGFSGRLYRPAIILDKAERARVAFVLPLATRSVVQAHFAEFWDLQKIHPNVANESVYDEHGGFRQEDLTLLREVTALTPFRDLRERFIQRGFAQ